MDNNINNEIQIKLKTILDSENKIEASQNFFKHYGKMASENLEFMKNLNKLMSKNAFIKSFLVLAVKEVTWNNELKNSFNIYGTRIAEFVELMTELDFIVSKPFGEIDELHYFTILDIVPNPEHFYRSSTNVIILTEKGKNFSLELLDYIKDKNTDNLNFALHQIIEKTQAYKTKFKQITELEYSQYNRYVTYPNGLTVDRRTLLGQKLDQDKKLAFKELKIEMLEQKKEQGLLSHKENNQLVILQNNSLALIEEEKIKSKNKNRCTITYNGVHSNLTDNEILKKSEYNSFNISKEQERQINKEAYNGQFDNEKLKQDEEYVKSLKLRGYHNERDFKDDYVGSCTKQEQSPEDFLNSLVGF